MYNFKDYLYFLTIINYHINNIDRINLGNYIITTRTKNTRYMVDINYGYEGIEYYVEIRDKNNELIYNTRYYKLSSSLEYVKYLDNKELYNYIFNKYACPNNKLYISIKYNKIKFLQDTNPRLAEEVGILSTKNPPLKVQKEVYENTKELLNKFENKKLNKKL